MTKQLSQNLSKLNEKQRQEIAVSNAVELMEYTDTLIDKQGVPKFVELRRCEHLPALKTEHGSGLLRAMITVLVKAFCSQLNVVRNMNEVQIIQCANFLMKNGDDMTMEDFVVMFEMAQNNRLGKILDRVDIQVVATMLESYKDYRFYQWRIINSDLDGETFKQIDAKNRADYEKAKAEGLIPENINATAEIEKIAKQMKDWDKPASKELQDQRKKQIDENRKNKLDAERESYAKAHGINIEQAKKEINISKPKEPSDNDINFWDSVFNPKKKNHARKNNSNDGRC